MNTNETILNFEAIDDHVLGAGFEALLTHAAAPAQRLIAAYRAVKPILAAIAALPILPTQWRLALRVFTGALDELAGSQTAVTAAPAPEGIPSDADFKAGKDL